MEKQRRPIRKTPECVPEIKTPFTATARGITEGDLAAALVEQLKRIAKDTVPEAIAQEAAERMASSILLRRYIEDAIKSLGHPPHDSSKEAAAKRATFNSLINAWRTCQLAFDDAAKLMRQQEHQRAVVPLADLLSTLGEKVTVTEIDYEVT